MNKKDWGWVFVKKPIKIDAREKSIIMKEVIAEIDKTSKLKSMVSRTDVKAGRVYLYYLFETHIPEGAILLKPLIDGKYFEYPLARFTLYDKERKDCTFDWQRSDDRWMTLGEGTLAECIQQAEVSDWINA